VHIYDQTIVFVFNSESVHSDITIYLTFKLLVIG